MKNVQYVILITVVTACDCNSIGSRNSICDQKTGQCSCQSNFGNQSCDQCNHGYYGFPSCSCNYYNKLYYQRKMDIKNNYKIVLWLAFVCLLFYVQIFTIGFFIKKSLSGMKNTLCNLSTCTLNNNPNKNCYFFIPHLLLILIFLAEYLIIF